MFASSMSSPNEEINLLSIKGNKVKKIDLVFESCHLLVNPRIKIKKVEHMKGGIMCHPRTRKSSTADQRKQEKDTNQHK